LRGLEEGARGARGGLITDRTLPVFGVVYAVEAEPNDRKVVRLVGGSCVPLGVRLAVRECLACVEPFPVVMQAMLREARLGVLPASLYLVDQGSP